MYVSIIIFISRLPERHKPIELATIKQQKCRNKKLSYRWQTARLV